MFLHLNGYELPVMLGTDEELSLERLPSGERAQRMQPSETQLPVATGRKLKSVPGDQKDHAL